MKVTANLKSIRIAPRKVRLTAKLIRGLDVADALDQLEVQVKRSNPFMLKLLKSAISNGENNFGLDKDNLYIFDVIVDGGSTLKRWMPKAYGRAGQILKRTSQIEIILEERVEGKGRKSKEELEKAKQVRIDAQKKAEKEAAADKKEEEKGEEKGQVKAEKKEVEKVKKVEKKGGITSKIFRRKSM